MRSTGLFLPYQKITSPDVPADGLFDRMLEQARHADGIGFDRLWLPEHHMVHYLQSPNPYMLAIQIGLNVQCRVGVMVTVLPLHHPVMVAEDIAVADNILGGRFEAGVGRGSYSQEFAHLQIDIAEGADRLAEGIDALLAIWDAEDSASYSGRFFQFEGAALWPKPVQRPHPPLWVAGRSGASIVRAAELGLNLATWPVTGPDSIVEEALQTFRSAQAPAPRVGDRQEFATMRMAYVSESEEAIDRALETILVNHRIGRYLHSDALGRMDSRGYVEPEPLPVEPSREELLQNLIVGSPEACRAKVERYARMGVDHLIVQMDFGLDQEETLASMNLFADAVLPAFYEAAA
jgi:alkanesulfonate monooxygenase SsuD/methylene tetrahydromethanopterin reductase-like flavin-dependent oxidoreductase (luciferase family)